MAEYVAVERSGPAIRRVLASVAPQELPEFEAEFRIALAEADDDFDLSRVDRVLDRWVAIAHLRLNPPTSAEQAIIEKVARGEFQRNGDIARADYRVAVAALERGDEVLSAADARRELGL